MLNDSFEYEDANGLTWVEQIPRKRQIGKSENFRRRSAWFRDIYPTLAPETSDFMGTDHLWYWQGNLSKRAPFSLESEIMKLFLIDFSLIETTYQHILIRCYVRITLYI